MYRRPFVWAAAALLPGGAAHAETDRGAKAPAHDIFEELIEINTTESAGTEFFYRYIEAISSH